MRAQNAIVTESGTDVDSTEALEIVCTCLHATWQSPNAETMRGLLEIAKAAMLRIDSNAPGRAAAVEEFQEAIGILDGERDYV